METPKTLLDNINPNVFIKKRKGLIIDSFINKNSNQDKKEEIPFVKISKILRKSKKCLNDIHLISLYLGQLEHFKKFLLINENTKLDDLLTMISLSLQYEYFDRERILFKYGIDLLIKGDKGYVFYIILNGMVTILKPTEASLYLTEEEYILYLVKLRRYSEFKILFSCLKNSMNLIKQYNDVNFILWLKNKENLTEKILKIFEEKVEIYTELKIIYDNKDDLEDKQIISVEEYISRYNIIKFNSNIKKKESLYTVYNYERVLKLGIGQKFGDASLFEGEQFRLT